MEIKALISILLLGMSLNVQAAPQAECMNGDQIDWDCLCHILCQVGEGGVACNCDGVPR